MYILQYQYTNMYTGIQKCEFVDNWYVYRHYSTPIVCEIYSIFRKNIKIYYIPKDLYSWVYYITK